MAKARGLKQKPHVRHLAFPTVGFHSVSLCVLVCAGPVVSFEGMLSCHTLPMVPTVH